MSVKSRKTLGQNFLTKSHLAASLVNDSSINHNDIVYEIGSGRGKLTIELSKRAKKVIAIEKDRELFIELQKKFAFNGNIEFHNADFLRYEMKEPCYKVFANVPFNITSAVVRKLVYAIHPPDEAYLIVQKEAAGKFIGVPATTQFSVLVKPWFRLKITRFFKRTDFSPVPSVDAVMLHTEKRTHPLVSPAGTSLYESFIKRGFGAWRKNLKSNYKNVFSHRQWKRLSSDLEFPIHAQPSELGFSQWIGLFEFYKKVTGN